MQEHSLVKHLNVYNLLPNTSAKVKQMWQLAFVARSLSQDTLVFVFQHFAGLTFSKIKTAVGEEFIPLWF